MKFDGSELLVELEALDLRVRLRFVDGEFAGIKSVQIVYTTEVALPFHLIKTLYEKAKRG